MEAAVSAPGSSRSSCSSRATTSCRSCSAEVSTLGHAPRVIGIYRRADLPTGARDVVLALWQVSDPGNVGTLVRTADAFGAGVALSPECADPTSPRALRASAGAIFRVPLVAWDELPGQRVALVAHGGTPLADAPLEPPLDAAPRLGARRAAGAPRGTVSQGDDRAPRRRRVAERRRCRRDRALRGRSPHGRVTAFAVVRPLPVWPRLTGNSRTSALRRRLVSESVRSGGRPG